MRRVGDEHHEAAGERDLLGEAGALGPDRVLGDLADDDLLGLEQLLDAGPFACRLAPRCPPRRTARRPGRARRSSACRCRRRPPPCRAARSAPGRGRCCRGSGRRRRPGAADVVLDQVAALEHGDLGQLGPDVDAHQVAADRPALALAAPPPLEPSVVERRPARRRGPRPARAEVRAGLAAGARCAAAAGALGVARAVAALDLGRPDVAAAAAGAGAGRLSPIWGLRTRARSAASTSWTRPSMGRSGSSSGSSPPVRRDPVRSARRAPGGSARCVPAPTGSSYASPASSASSSSAAPSGSSSSSALGARRPPPAPPAA